MRKLIKHILTAKFSLALAIGIAILILYLSLMPTENLPKVQINQADKLYHLTAYIALAFAWFTYFLIFKNKKEKITFNIIALALIVFGIVVEVLQMTLTDYRTFDWWDILSNSAGILIVYGLFKLNKSKLGKLKHQLNV